MIWMFLWPQAHAADEADWLSELRGGGFVANGREGQRVFGIPDLPTPFLFFPKDDDLDQLTGALKGKGYTRQQSPATFSDTPFFVYSRWKKGDRVLDVCGQTPEPGGKVWLRPLTVVPSDPLVEPHPLWRTPTQGVEAYLGKKRVTCRTRDDVDQIHEVFHPEGRYERVHSKLFGTETLQEGRFEIHGSTLHMSGRMEIRVGGQHPEPTRLQAWSETCEGSAFLVTDAVSFNTCTESLCVTEGSAPSWDGWVVVMDGGAGAEAVDLLGRVARRAVDPRRKGTDVVLEGGMAKNPRDQVQVLHRDVDPTRAMQLAWRIRKDLDVTGVSVVRWEHAPAQLVVVAGGEVSLRSPASR